MTKKLNMLATIQDGLRIALVNFLSLIAATILYILTIWIPYLNVGTTIAMSSLPAELAKGKVINPLFIFEGKYRRNIGEYFILIALMTIGTYVGFTFLIIPGIVISIAWSLATPLFVDKDTSSRSDRKYHRRAYHPLHYSGPLWRRSIDLQTAHLW